MFGDAYKYALNELKKIITLTPIMQPSNQDLPFDIMCDESGFAIGIVLGQKS